MEGTLEMAELKLPRLPDRSSAKLTINVAPDLRQALDDYAELYHATSGQAEAVVDLIPAMLSQFLASDREFARRRKLHSPGA